MYKFVLIVLFTLSYSVETASTRVQSRSVIIDFRKLNYNEKIDTLSFIKAQSNKLIIHFLHQSLEVQNIISIDRDSVEVELLDSWWWNKPKQPILYHSNKSPIKSIDEHINEPSYSRMLPMQAIIEIQIIQKKPLIILLLPALVVIVVMGFFWL